MYRCKECGCEYREKPDFCDCGNDTFEEIEEPITTFKSATRIDKAELLSRFIFGACIILSILVLIFFPKIKNEPADKTTQKPVNIVKTTNPNIPPLDSFWIESKPQAPQPVEETPTPVVQQIKEIFVKPQNIERQQVQKPVAKPKPVTKTVKTTTTAKPQQQKTVNKPKPAAVTKPKPSTTARTNTYELLNYKNRLRNTLLSNLRFSQVQGSGDCGIEFAVDSSGKLINRAFTYQSDNKSVNDEVYKMLMRTPRFAAPPASYHGEKIKMVFRLNNNNYSVEFVR